MSRGPRPRRTLPDALALARHRGMVQVAGRCPDRLYHFSIVSEIPVAFVQAKFCDRILAPLPEILRTFRDAILELRSIVCHTAISRELWLRSRHGTWRFFRVTADSLLELGRDGKPVS